MRSLQVGYIYVHREKNKGYNKMIVSLTDGEGMIPPVCLAEPGLEFIGGVGDNSNGWGDKGPDHQQGRENSHNDSQTLHQIQVCDFYRLS